MRKVKAHPVYLARFVLREAELGRRAAVYLANENDEGYGAWVKLPRVMREQGVDGDEDRPAPPIGSTPGG